MIIDSHTHWGMGWEVRDRGNPAKWLSVLNRHRVDRAILMPHAGIHRMDMCQADNDTVASVAARAEGRLVPVGSAWPQQGEEAVAEARRCIERLGMRGLKFHPWLQGFSTADSSFGEICGLAGEWGVPVFFHDGTPCYAASEQVGGLARRFPRTQFVLGHSGLLWSWRSALEAARRPNVWACLCGPHVRAMEAFCRRGDPDRLVWGSDFGFGFTDPIGYRLGLLNCARIGDALRARILGENPLRLLGGG